MSETKQYPRPTKSQKWCERRQYLKAAGLSANKFCKCGGNENMCTVLDTLKVVENCLGGCCTVGYPRNPKSGIKHCKDCDHFNGSQCTDTDLMINRNPMDKACEYFAEQQK